MTADEKFGALLRSVRVMRRIPRRVIAASLGVAETTVFYLEQEGRLCRRKLEQIAKAYNIELSKLVGSYSEFKRQELSEKDEDWGEVARLASQLVGPEEAE